jgi:hypothetical protein
VIFSPSAWPVGFAVDGAAVQGAAVVGLAVVGAEVHGAAVVGLAVAVRDSSRTRSVARSGQWPIRQSSYVLIGAAVSKTLT